MMIAVAVDANLVCSHGIQATARAKLERVLEYTLLVFFVGMEVRGGA